jgi:hypothetical protein
VGEARRTHPGPAAERVDLEARVVGEREHAGAPGEVVGLDAGVLEEGRAVLDDLGWISFRHPHAFTVVSPEGARFFAFLPRQGAHMATQYLEGGPPLGAELK